MKVAIVFEAPDELSGANLSPEEFLRAYNERLFGIKIIGIDMPKHYNLAAQEGEKVLVVVASERKPHTSVSTTLEGMRITADDVKQIKTLDPGPPPDGVVEQIRQLDEQIKAITIVPEPLSDKRIGTDGSWAAMEARDRRQQHKLAVKFSNRRK